MKEPFKQQLVDIIVAKNGDAYDKATLITALIEREIIGADRPPSKGSTWGGRHVENKLRASQRELLKGGRNNG